MRLGALLCGVELCEYTFGAMDIEVVGISSDSKTIGAGELFVCIEGMRSDGHDFAAEAVRRGACAVVAESWKGDLCGLAYGDFPVVRVKNARKALAFIWSNYYGSPGRELHLIGVTGTNGKTSVTNMLAAIFEKAAIPCALIGTITHTLTTPDPEQLYRELRRLADEGKRYVFIEISSHALSLHKADALRFECGIFTNLTREHLDFHKTMEAYFEAKLRLLELSDAMLINTDDEYGTEFLKRAASCRTYTYSAKDPEADFYAGQVELCGTDGVSYQFVSAGRLMRIRSPIPGGFTVYNTLAATSAACLCGLPSGAVREGIAELHGVCGRIERIPLPMPDVAFYIDYAHTPDALANVLRSLRGFMKPEQRLKVLFGCGGDRDPGKRPIMGRVASEYADHLIVTSDNSRSEDKDAIISQILTGVDRESCSVEVIVDRRRAIEHSVENAECGDVILLAGKGHEDYEIDGLGKHPFSEREILRAAARRVCRERRDEEKTKDKTRQSNETDFCT